MRHELVVVFVSDAEDNIRGGDSDSPLLASPAGKGGGYDDHELPVSAYVTLPDFAEDLIADFCRRH